MALGSATLKATNARPEGVLQHVAEVEGAPVNGQNLIPIPFVDAGISPESFDEAYLEVNVTALNVGSTVLFAEAGVHPDPLEAGSFLRADKKEIAMNFVQTGADQVLVQIVLRKSEIQ